VVDSAGRAKPSLGQLSGASHLARRPRLTPPHARLLDLWPRGRADAVPREQPAPVRVATATDAPDPQLVRVLHGILPGASGRRLVDGDAVVWDDEASVRILQTCRRAMGEGAKLLVVEQVVPSGNEYHSSKFDDLNMLALFQGHERTAEEFRGLLATAGFTLSRILPTSSQWSVVEAVPQ
jgi:O-methyltransferase domain